MATRNTRRIPTAAAAPKPWPTKEEGGGAQTIRDEQIELGQLLRTADVEAALSDAATTLRGALEALPMTGGSPNWRPSPTKASCAPSWSKRSRQPWLSFPVGSVRWPGGRPHDSRRRPRLAGILSRSLAPRVPLTVSQWADAERYLSSKGSAKPGKWGPIATRHCARSWIACRFAAPCMTWWP